MFNEEGKGRVYKKAGGFQHLLENLYLKILRRIKLGCDCGDSCFVFGPSLVHWVIGPVWWQLSDLSSAIFYWKPLTETVKTLRFWPTSPLKGGEMGRKKSLFCQLSPSKPPSMNAPSCNRLRRLWSTRLARRENICRRPTTKTSHAKSDRKEVQDLLRPNFDEFCSLSLSIYSQKSEDFILKSVQKGSKHWKKQLLEFCSPGTTTKGNRMSTAKALAAQIAMSTCRPSCHSSAGAFVGRWQHVDREKVEEMNIRINEIKSNKRFWHVLTKEG